MICDTIRDLLAIVGAFACFSGAFLLCLMAVSSRAERRAEEMRGES